MKAITSEHIHPLIQSLHQIALNHSQIAFRSGTLQTSHLSWPVGFSFRIFLQVPNLIPGRRWSHSSLEVHHCLSRAPLGYARVPGEGPSSAKPAPSTGSHLIDQTSLNSVSAVVFCLSFSTWPRFQSSLWRGSASLYPSLYLALYLSSTSVVHLSVFSCAASLSRTISRDLWLIHDHRSSSVLLLFSILQLLNSPFAP